MTAKELNRDCKRLIASFNRGEAYGEKSQAFNSEFKRIYYADTSFEYLSAKNALCLMRINLSLRIVPLHQFGINFETI